MTEQLAALYAAYAAAQAELTNPKKDGKANAGQYSYTYATLGAILDHVRPVLAAHGLAVMQNVTNDGDAVAVETILTHSGGGGSRSGRSRVKPRRLNGRRSGRRSRTPAGTPSPPPSVSPPTTTTTPRRPIGSA